MDTLDWLYIFVALVFQVALIIHFALRKWRFEFAIRYGWIFYALSIPACAVSILLLLAGKSWFLWLGGFLFLIWAAFGYIVEYIKQIEWRSPVYRPVFGPYIILYLATVMFFWWPVARLYKPLWYLFTFLFCAGTVLNITSHKKD